MPNVPLARSGNPEALRFALILRGWVVVKVKGWTLERLEEGETFGSMGLLHQSAWEVGEVYVGSEGVDLVSLSYHAVQARLQQEAPARVQAFYQHTARVLAWRLERWLPRYSRECARDDRVAGEVDALGL